MTRLRLKIRTVTTTELQKL